VTSPGSARNARPRRNAVSKDASSAAPAAAPAVRSRAAAATVTASKASKTAATVKTAAAGTTKRVANGRAAANPAPAEIVKNGKALSRARDNKDHPLFEDIRYLGRLLGDVVREQEGDEVFAVVETIRQTAVKFRREEDNEASQTLEKRLKSLSPEQTVSVVRAFSYFSHLANIAEDRHHNRRRRIHALAGSAPQPTVSVSDVASPGSAPGIGRATLTGDRCTATGRFPGGGFLPAAIGKPDPYRRRGRAPGRSAENGRVPGGALSGNRIGRHGLCARESRGLPGDGEDRIRVRNREDCVLPGAL